jgi:hypothetical protein
MDGGVAEDQAVNGLGLLLEDRDGCRRAAGMVEIAGVGMEGGMSVMAWARLSAGLRSARSSAAVAPILLPGVMAY